MEKLTAEVDADNRPSTVGRSSRTPFKHFLLNALLGREAGIYALCPQTVHATASPWHIIDMNAGDGLPGTDGETSSPAVIFRHASFAALSKRRVPVKVTLIEKAESTFQRLSGNVPTGHSFAMELINGDSSTYRVPATSKHQAVFVHTDPNSLGDWCVNPDLVASFPETTTLLATLGCNVGGLKRLPIDQRMCWFEHVESITQSMPRYHDVLIVTIRRMLVNHKMQRDPSHWAYLIRSPHKWTKRIIDAAHNGAKSKDLEIDVASIRDSAVTFESITRELFLTKSELASPANTATS